MAATESGSTTGEILRCDAVLLQEVLRHQPTGRGAFGAEREAFALELHQLIRAGDRFQAAGAMGDEHAGEFSIDIALRQHLGSRSLESGLNTREATEPDQIQAAAAESTDGSGVIAHRDVFHLHIQLIAQLIRQGAVETIQLLGVLIGNGTDPQR